MMVYMSESLQYYIPKTLDMEHKLSACIFFLFLTSFFRTFVKNASIIFRVSYQIIKFNINKMRNIKGSASI